MNKYKILKGDNLQILIKYENVDFDLIGNYMSIFDRKYFEGCKIIASNAAIPSEIVYQISKSKRLFVGDLINMGFKVYDDPMSLHPLSFSNMDNIKSFLEKYNDNGFELESDDDAKLYFEATI